jgi:hypothetical protein
VREAFSQFGTVISVTLAEDRHTGCPRGFGYVEMEGGEDAAIAGLNRTDLRGQPLTVCGARPKDPPPSAGLIVGRTPFTLPDRGQGTGLAAERRAFGRRDDRPLA